MTAKDTRSSVAAYDAVTIASTATLIRPANTGRRSIVIQNNGTADMFIGYSSTVTTSTGLKLTAGSSMYEDRYTGALYGIVATGTQTANYAEVGNANN